MVSLIVRSLNSKAINNAEIKPMIDYYEILEVSPNASQEVIRQVYKILLHRYNLEHDSEDRADVQKLHHLNLAYDVLSDPDKRNAYDQELETARTARNQSAYIHNGDVSVAETAAKFSQDSNKASILSRIKWNRWGWSVSILAVAAILISMVRPDPEKAHRGQVAVKSHVEKKGLESGLQKTAESNQPAENKGKAEQEN